MSGDPRQVDVAPLGVLAVCAGVDEVGASGGIDAGALELPGGQLADGVESGL